MLAALPKSSHKTEHQHFVPHNNDLSGKTQNRVLLVLIRRLHYSKTFGENIIFMLNRTESSNSEDLCLQLLILKMLYLLFTTTGAHEYFYTNDLHVLVDVFLREISNLGDEHESLRHTYLRVLHPLLNNTQMKNAPYKANQILRTLESLIDKADIREVSSTTRRLVDRCLNGEWCTSFRRSGTVSPTSSSTTDSSAGNVNIYVTSATPSSSAMSKSHVIVANSTGGLTRERSLKTSRSV